MKILALTTSTCVKCKSVIPKVKELCDQHGTELVILDALTDPEAKSYVSKYSISSVPVFILLNGVEEVVLRGEDAYHDIKSMLLSAV